MIERLLRHRYRIGRRCTQAGVIALFVLGLRTDWTVLGRELTTGDLSAARVLGAVPLADPFATLQIWFSGHPLLWETLLGALLVTGFYFLVGGRAFCAWVCPMNPVTDLAAWLRRRLGLPPGRGFSRNTRYGVLTLALLLSLLTGVAAFEWVSPIGMLHRGLIYGAGLGWLAAAGVFLLDLLVLRHGWCGHLCPLGAAYSLIGRFSPLRVAFAPEGCTRCGVCHQVCPEPQVLNLRHIAEQGWVESGACTNCGSCITDCPEACFRFGLRLSGRPVAPGTGADALGRAHRAA